MTDTPSPYIVGLTGGIGSGKSVVADMFRQLGVEVIDADLLAREAVQPGSAALESIKQHFGADFITPDGNLHRHKLRQHVFADPAAKTWLEQLLHPLIQSAIKQRLHISPADSHTGNRPAYILLVSPLLLETNQHKLVQRVLIVDVDRQTQLQRTLARDGGDAETINAIIDTQMNQEQRLKKADDIIDNNGSLDILPMQIEKLHSNYLRLSRTPANP
ncbi:MAG: dephospho-CoA kinase [Pseudohongiellaceae bacterium]